MCCLIYYKSFRLKLEVHGWMQRGEGTGGPYPPENHKTIGFLSNSREPLKNHKATKPAFWRAYDGLFIVVFGSSIPSST